MDVQVSDNVAYYQGTTTANGTSGAWGGIQQPSHICPGCGRCKDCGRPYETQPYSPWPGYPNPYIGDPNPNPWGGPWFGTTTITSGQSNMTIPSGGFPQVWN